jgi:hypothetical protein
MKADALVASGGIVAQKSIKHGWGAQELSVLSYRL